MYLKMIELYDAMVMNACIGDITTIMMNNIVCIATKFEL